MRSSIWYKKFFYNNDLGPMTGGGVLYKEGVGSESGGIVKRGGGVVAWFCFGDVGICAK